MFKNINNFFCKSYVLAKSVIYIDLIGFITPIKYKRL